jgi:hypothetical protein
VTAIEAEAWRQLCRRYLQESLGARLCFGEMEVTLDQLGRELLIVRNCSWLLQSAAAHAPRWTISALAFVLQRSLHRMIEQERALRAAAARGRGSNPNEGGSGDVE